MSWVAVFLQARENRALWFFGGPTQAEYMEDAGFCQVGATRHCSRPLIGQGIFARRVSAWRMVGRIYIGFPSSIA